jgi:hypothetical protein
MTNYFPLSNIDDYEIENTFYLRSHISRVAKLLAHYELYKMITDIPGTVVELGVYKGASLMRFATFRHVLENSYSRSIVGFDAFGDFPMSGIHLESDKKFINKFEDSGGSGISNDDLLNFLKKKQIENVELVKGNIFDTVPKYLSSVPELKIALLHLDLDVFEPTSFALEHLLPHMVRGGIVIFDDYGLIEGATLAIDNMCKTRNYKLKKLSFYKVPSYLIID